MAGGKGTMMGDASTEPRILVALSEIKNELRVFDERLQGLEGKVTTVTDEMARLHEADRLNGTTAKAAEQAAYRVKQDSAGFEAEIYSALVNVKREMAEELAAAVKNATKPSKRERHWRTAWRLISPTIMAVVVTVLARYGLLSPSQVQQLAPRPVPTAPSER